MKAGLNGGNGKGLAFSKYCKRGVSYMDIMSFNKSKKEELILTLYGLIDNWEDEVIEFKEAGKDYDREKIGRYFSTLSNEANLRGLQYAWLVFGVNNKE